MMFKKNGDIMVGYDPQTQPRAYLVGQNDVKKEWGYHGGLRSTNTAQGILVGQNDVQKEWGYHGGLRSTNTAQGISSRSE